MLKVGLAADCAWSGAGPEPRAAAPASSAKATRSGLSLPIRLPLPLALGLVRRDASQVLQLPKSYSSLAKGSRLSAKLGYGRQPLGRLACN